MVHGPDGGSDRLVDLTDRYGEAIEADFIRFYNGREIADYLTGKRPVRQAIRLINMLPPESATATQRRLDPHNRPSSSRRRKQDTWIDSYHRQPKDVLMDLWELEANKGRKKSSTRKQHPDPTRK